MARGRRYLGAPLSDDSIDVWLARAAHATSDPYETLTGREREIVQLVAEGHSSTAIAGRLSISARTAEAHRANVMRKLRLRNQAALIRYALSRGLLVPLLGLPRVPLVRRYDRRGRRALRQRRGRGSLAREC